MYCNVGIYHGNLLMTDLERFEFEWELQYSFVDYEKAFDSVEQEGILNSLPCLESIFRKINWERKGLDTNGQYLNNLRFADGIILMSETAEELQDMLKDLNRESLNAGLTMNRSITKFMFNSRKITKKNKRAMERLMIEVSLRDKKRCIWIRDQTKIKDIIELIKEQKRRWAGHLSRREDDRWSKRLIDWYPSDGKRSERHPDPRWKDEIVKYAGNT
nr:uncharacterized protein LOC113829174 [Penaeus vannamei]